PLAGHHRGLVTGGFTEQAAVEQAVEQLAHRILGAGPGAPLAADLVHLVAPSHLVERLVRSCPQKYAQSAAIQAFPATGQPRGCRRLSGTFTPPRPPWGAWPAHRR